jgi:cell division protein FtsI/penicillin-binding protein 2/cell division protein FtsW (lipid II flippase)
MPRRWLAIEAAALALAVVLAWWVGGVATSAWLARAGEVGRAVDADAVHGLARRASLLFSIGVVVLGAARVVGARRGRDPIVAPWLVPAAVGASLLGLVVHLATYEDARLPSGAAFAEGFLVGSIGAAVVLVVPVDLAELASRYRAGIALAIGAIFGALAVAGSGPAGTGTRINLGPIQPIEAIKPLAIVFLAAFLGARASKLRWQRRRVVGLRWPRLELMLPALGVLVLIVAGLYVIGDLGPVLLLAFVFLGMFFVVTRATGWAVVALALVAALFVVLAVVPGIADVGTVQTRLRMWHDPWSNGLTNGHQLGEGLWAAAAGGWTGQGLADNAAPLVPAGKTDLILVTMTEQLGAAWLVAYIALVGAIVLGGLFVAARSRTAERVLLAAGAAILIGVQWFVIQAGSLGQLPLTGIVAPFLSAGRSSMVAFLALVALLARLAQDGHARAASTELDELHGAARTAGAFAAGLLALGVVTGIRAAVTGRDDVSARPIAVTLADGTRVARQNPRLLAIAAQIRRGTIADRNGKPLAVSAAAGERSYPLGTAMGTLLGVHPSRVLLPRWALERTLDARLRIELRALTSLLSLGDAERAARIRAIDADVASRSVQLTIDADLQAAVADLLRAAVSRGKRSAAAAVVIDVDTGQVLARVQAPDYDPNEAAWQDRVLDGDTTFLARFRGAYGEWPDKTGTQGMFQAGSVAKLFTALVAARQRATSSHYTCVDEDEQGPFFVQRGWHKPIHDHHNDRPHGDVDLVEAIAVSCNVYFAQLGLALGPDPFRALRDDGLDIGFGGAAGFDPGEPGSRQLASTAFGQGAMAINVMQAARLVAAIASGGHYRRCPPTMELDAACSDTTVIDDPTALAPVIEGMRRVMTSGTGARLDEPDGLRVYGKTGTADVRGFVGEEPFGIRPRQVAAPHSWFVAFAEPADATDGSGRIAVAVVVPRGGTGASAAGPLAMQILAAARDAGYIGARR